MDVLRIKHPRHAVASVDGRRLTLRPLSPFQLEQADSAADMWLGDARRAPGGADHLVLERIVRVLSRASGETCENLRGLRPRQLLELHAAWVKAQDESFPESTERFQGWIRRRVNDDPGIMADGVRAYICDSPADYYNRPLADLTDGQVLYWQVLRAAHNEWHVPDHNGRKPTPTKQWLNSDD